jgi:hypothetical protein
MGSEFCKAHYLQLTALLFQPNALHIVNDMHHFYDSSFGYPVVYDYDQRVHAWAVYDREKNTCSISVVNYEWQTLWTQFCHQCVQKLHKRATQKGKTDEDKKQDDLEMSWAEDVVFEKLKGKLAYETVTFDAMQEMRFCTGFGSTVIYSPPKSADQLHYFDSSHGSLMWMAKRNLDEGMKIVERWEQSQTKSEFTAQAAEL